MSFFKNLSGLFFVQLLNQFLPLFIIPFLTKSLGVESYGVYAYILSICFFCAVFFDFGFGIWGVERIVKRRSSTIRLSTIYSNVVNAKIIIFFCIFVFYFSYAIFNEKYYEYRSEFFLGGVVLLSMAFQPQWVFMGLERVVFLTLSVFVGRVSFLFFVVFFVKSKDDLFLLIFLNSFSQFITLFAEIYFLRRFKIGYLKFDLRKAIFYLKKSFRFFTSRLAVSLYTVGGSVFLGFFSNPSNVAIYSIADQMYKGAQSLLSPINQIMYPYMMRTKNFLFFYKMLLFSMAAAFVGVVFGFSFSDVIIEYLFGSGFLEAVGVLYILLICIMITTPSVLLGYPFLGACGIIEKANWSVIYGGLVQIALCIIVYFFFSVNATSVAYSVLGAEFFVLIFRIYWGISGLKSRRF